MHKKTTQLVALSLSVLVLAGCETINKQDIGMLSGGVAGGLIGSQFGGGTGRLVAIGAGTLAGAFIGGAIGKNMDATDKLKAEQALEKTPTGQSSLWENPDNGNRYHVTPKKTVKRQGRYCREYIMTAEIAGKKQQTYGTACRQPDGSWKVQAS
jgi:surface antigen